MNLTESDPLVGPARCSSEQPRAHNSVATPWIFAANAAEGRFLSEVGFPWRGEDGASGDFENVGMAPAHLREAEPLPAPGMSRRNDVESVTSRLFGGDADRAGTTACAEGDG